MTRRDTIPLGWVFTSIRYRGERGVSIWLYRSRERWQWVDVVGIRVGPVHPSEASAIVWAQASGYADAGACAS